MSINLVGFDMSVSWLVWLVPVTWIICCAIVKGVKS